ncbi:MAG TPA: YfiR family protein [Bryobacteraceae bacterium]|nr:YfiR family protein [Bryobacteraceae bacterium]
MDALTHPRNRILACLWLLISLLFPLSAVGLRAAEPPPLEYQVRAAFLLNFTRFIEWPKAEVTSTGSPFVICVDGEDPFGPTLDQLVDGETVNGRKILVHRTHGEANGSCAILYVARQEKNVRAILAAVGPGVLTVGEGDSFLDEGGMIAFVLENRRVRFNIDQGAAHKAGLQLSSRLLNVARSIR